MPCRCCRSSSPVSCWAPSTATPWWGNGLAAFSGLYYAIAVLSAATYRQESPADLETSLRATVADRARYLQARAAVG